jgi:hypothetical protein
VKSLCINGFANSKSSETAIVFKGYLAIGKPKPASSAMGSNTPASWHLHPAVFNARSIFLG